MLRKLPGVLAPNLTMGFRIWTTVKELEILLHHVFLRVSVLIDDMKLYCHTSRAALTTPTFYVRLHPIVVTIDDFSNRNLQSISRQKRCIPMDGH